MNFVDEARVYAIAGAGGDGSTAFHHEPYKPKGGPDGGDGGDGGDVIFQADLSVGTLLDVRDHPHIKAGRGGHGLGKRRHGSRGEDRIVKLPVGTAVFDEEGVLIADLAAGGESFVAARGGRGGRGNAQFSTATRRAPAFAEKGEPGQERRLQLELRLLADVGLVGFPNAGKSTLISRISAAKPKIADYPFTTLAPNLGVVKRGDGSSFVVADIPGLVPGAHEGRGLGLRFLRHVRRAAILVFLVDLATEERDPATDVQVLQDELRAFDPELAERPSLSVATKLDVATDANVERVHAALGEIPAISAVTGEGIDALVGRLGEEVEKARADAPSRVGYVRHVVREQPLAVHREGDAWRVTGLRAERAVATTDIDNEEAVARLQRRLISMGVERMLAAAGARRGDEVRIADNAFDFEPEGEVDGEAAPSK